MAGVSPGLVSPPVDGIPDPLSGADGLSSPDLTSVKSRPATCPPLSTLGCALEGETVINVLPELVSPLDDEVLDVDSGVDDLSTLDLMSVKSRPTAICESVLLSTLERLLSDDTELDVLELVSPPLVAVLDSDSGVDDLSTLDLMSVKSRPTAICESVLLSTLERLLSDDTELDVLELTSPPLDEVLDSDSGGEGLSTLDLKSAKSCPTVVCDSVLLSTLECPLAGETVISVLPELVPELVPPLIGGVLDKDSDCDDWSTLDSKLEKPRVDTSVSIDGVLRLDELDSIVDSLADSCSSSFFCSSSSSCS